MKMITTVTKAINPIIRFLGLSKPFLLERSSSIRGSSSPSGALGGLIGGWGGLGGESFEFDCSSREDTSLS